MNQLQYKLLTYLNNKTRVNSKINTEKYWNDFYEIACIENKDKILITYQEFSAILTEIYNTLILKLEPLTVHQIIDHYLTLILADIILDKQEINTNHFLECMVVCKL